MVKNKPKVYIDVTFTLMKQWMILIFLLCAITVQAQTFAQPFKLSSISNEDSTKVVEFTIDYFKKDSVKISKLIRPRSAADNASAFALFEAGNYTVIMDPDQGQFIQLKNVSTEKDFYLIPFNTNEIVPQKMLEAVIPRINLDCACKPENKKRFITYDYNPLGYLTIQCADYSYNTDPGCAVKFHSSVFDYSGRFILVPAKYISLQ